jgi:hypothetical protein
VDVGLTLVARINPQADGGGRSCRTTGLVGGGSQVFLPWVADAWVVRSGGF